MHVIPLAAFSIAAFVSLASAQTTPPTPPTPPTGTTPLDPPQNGPRITDPGYHRLVGATVHLGPGVSLDNATVIIDGGKIRAVRHRGTTVGYMNGRLSRVAIDVATPEAYRQLEGEGARTWDYDGLHIYPGFVDAWVTVEAPAPNRNDPGSHWSVHVTPQRRALDAGGISKDDAETLRAIGFTTAALAPEMSKEGSGLFGGLGAVVNLGDHSGNASAADPLVLEPDAFHAMDFNTDGWGGELVYPTSQMGAIALIRQTLLDVGWQARQRERGEPIARNALDTLTDLRARPVMLNTDRELELFQAEAIYREFEGQPLSGMVLVGSGTEFKRLSALSDTGLPVVLPLRTPRAPDVSSIAKADAVDLTTLMTWEQAPTNAARVADAGITFAITSSKLRKRADFHEHLRRAIEHGLAPDDAFAALTTTPAELLGVDDRVGSIGLGKVANLVVASGDLFDADTDAEIRDVWVEGVRYEITKDSTTPFEGEWHFFVGPEDAPFFEMEFEVEDGEIEMDHVNDAGEEIEQKARKASVSDSAISFLIDDEDGGEGTYTVEGSLVNPDTIVGTGKGPDESIFQWTAKRLDDEDEDEPDADDEPRESPNVPDAIGYPFGPYARAELPEPEHVVFRDATVWTSDDRGILDPGEVEIRDGRIAYVGEPRSRAPRGARVIELDGKHLTPGLLDAHSHTGTWTFGTNEAGQAVTAEVRMGDTNDPDAINWYRQLAAGVTTVNTLHGSANAMGGQSITQKVRWGAPHPRDMHMDAATPGIKFALGENVRQVNWGDQHRSRYPQSRMGVDAIMRDRFTAAREYAQARAAGRDPKPDLELDALAQILAGERLIHCHSYRQDEILMLAEIARDFGFQIGSYQHALECYKVAEHVHEVSLGSSMFSDWWAYKIEVQDAIPYAGPIEWAVGGRVSYNSDSDELARRMNTEAAKAFKYAKLMGIDLPQDEALKFVTINPAIQLGIDDRVGSLAKGKDADIAIWSASPLSTYARCESTWIDGREYFSLEQDRADRERDAAERARIIQKILADPDAKTNGDDDQSDDSDNQSEIVDRPTSLRDRIALERWKRHLHELHLTGNLESLDTTKPGDCGCNLTEFGILR